jgi:hypothetical protein
MNHLRFFPLSLLLFAFAAPAQAAFVEVPPHTRFDISGVPFEPFNTNIWVNYVDPARTGGGDGAVPTVASVVFVAPAVLDPAAVFAGIYEQETTPPWGLELAAFFVAAGDLDLDPLYRLGYSAAKTTACLAGDCGDYAAIGIPPGSPDFFNLELLDAAASDILVMGSGYILATRRPRLRAA